MKKENISKILNQTQNMKNKYEGNLEPKGEYGRSKHEENPETK